MKRHLSQPRFTAAEPEAVVDGPAPETRPARTASRAVRRVLEDSRLEPEEYLRTWCAGSGGE